MGFHKQTQDKQILIKFMVYLLLKWPMIDFVLQGGNTVEQVSYSILLFGLKVLDFFAAK